MALLSYREVRGALLLSNRFSIFVKPRFSDWGDVVVYVIGFWSLEKQEKETRKIRDHKGYAVCRLGKD